MTEEKAVWWCDILFQAFQKLYTTTYNSEISIVSIVLPEWSKSPDGSIDYMVDCNSGLLTGTDIIRVQLNICRSNSFEINVHDLTINSVVLHFQSLMTNDAKFVLINKDVIDKYHLKFSGSFIKFEQERFKYNKRKLEFGAWFPMMSNALLRSAAKHIGNITKDLRFKSISRTWFPQNKTDNRDV